MTDMYGARELSQLAPRWKQAADDPLPIAVRLTVDAARELAEVELDSSREYGGWMFGRVEGFEVVVHALRGANWEDGNKGERSSVTFSGAYAADMEMRFDAIGWQAVGTWHSHPSVDEDAPLRLSGGDEDSAVEASRTWRHSQAVLLLAASDIVGAQWSSPRMKAWTAHDDGSVRESLLIIEQQED